MNLRIVKNSTLIAIMGAASILLNGRIAHADANCVSACYTEMESCYIGICEDQPNNPECNSCEGIPINQCFANACASGYNYCVQECNA